MTDSITVKNYFIDLQSRIIAAMEEVDGKSFITDSWDRPDGGGGISRVLEDGNVFERGGVNFSHVMGDQ
ncbi:coproporphyrinogen III oxidase, partial [Undibacterium sp.]|uniref:coproporphyrinogen III oxidase n=1 Tax=Undibacterium sp. TaxID=1914977 RepID=UPI002BC45264